MEEERQFEKENIDRIIQEIKESDQFSSNIEKAYYLYLRLGKIYKYNGNIKYRNHNTKEELDEKLAIYNEKTSEKGEAACNRFSLEYQRALHELGINVECNFIEIVGEFKHVSLQFQDENGVWYYTDLTDDLMHIQTGMRTRSFGISLEQIREKGQRASLIVKYLEKKQSEDPNRKWGSIPEEDLM